MTVLGEELRISVEGLFGGESDGCTGEGLKESALVGRIDPTMWFHILPPEDTKNGSS